MKSQIDVVYHIKNISGVQVPFRLLYVARKNRLKGEEWKKMILLC